MDIEANTLSLPIEETLLSLIDQEKHPQVLTGPRAMAINIVFRVAALAFCPGDDIAFALASGSHAINSEDTPVAILYESPQVERGPKTHGMRNPRYD